MIKVKKSKKSKKSKKNNFQKFIINNKYLILVLAILIIFILLILKKNNYENFFVNNSEIDNHKIKNNNLFFIHIPKNAGTYFQQHFLKNNKVIGHKTIQELPQNIHHLTVAIIRNPYDRMVSFYTYAKQDKNMYHNKDSNKHSHYDYASTHTFDEYVEALFNKKLHQDEHSSPQINYIMYQGNIPCKYLLRFENLKEEIKNKLNLEVTNSKEVNKSSNKDWRTFYKSTHIKNLVYEMYKKDFKYLNYNKDF